MRNRKGNGSIESLTLALALATVCGGLGSLVRAQCETKRTAPDGAYYDKFGGAVSIEGTMMLIGAHGDDDTADSAGSAYIYRDFNREAKLLASDGEEDDYFGRAVSLSGDVAVVGAPGSIYTTSPAGAVYVFRYDGFKWVEEAILQASDGGEEDNFGYSVSIDGDVIVVGASGKDAAYVYRYDSFSGWVEEAKLEDIGGYWGDNFGSPVSISGDAIVVGASGYESDSGAAFVFRYNGSDWDEEAILEATDGDSDDRFGMAVCIDGDAVVIGAHHDEANGYKAGSAYVFRYTGAIWYQEDKLMASDGVTYDTFGESVAISGDAVVVGAVWEDDMGSAYLYRYNGYEWPEDTKLMATDRDLWDWYGDAVAIDGDSALIGAYGDADHGDSSGSVYVYDINCDPDPTFAISSDPLIAGDYTRFVGTHLKPFEQTYFAYTLGGLGSTYVPSLNITLDLGGNVKGITMGTTDTWGFVYIQLQIPNAAAGHDVWLQGCQYELKTNVVATSVE